MQLNTRYCKKTPGYVIAQVTYFMNETSRLPSVAVSEIAYHEDFEDFFEDFVGERRRWLELVTYWSKLAGRVVEYALSSIEERTTT